MNYPQMSAPALAELLGDRVKLYRLNNNVSQEELMALSGITTQKISRAEKGKGTLETYLALMLALGATEHLDSFLPPTPLFPIQLAKLKGKERKRASGKKLTVSNNEEGLDW